MKILEIIDKGNKIIIKGLKDFEPKHIFECGQCFRWNLEYDGSYTGVAYDRVLNVRKDNDIVIFNNIDIEDFNNIWVEYFDLNNDYGKVKSALMKKDEPIKAAINFGYGIRILRQEPWETLISFIISANNAIPRIKKSIELLSKNFGKYLGQYNGNDYYSFPSPKVISKLSDEQIKHCGVGYRSDYILETAKKIVNENIFLEQFKKLSSEDCYNAVLKFKEWGQRWPAVFWFCYG